jgi:hypothetical protein
MNLDRKLCEEHPTSHPSQSLFFRSTVVSHLKLTEIDITCHLIKIGYKLTTISDLLIHATEILSLK